MQFDWYRSTIDASPQVVFDTLANCYELADAIPTKPLYGYERAYIVQRGDTQIFRIQWGGNTGTRVLAEASGDQAPEFSKHVRQKFTDHSLTRADVALDYCEEGAWESLYGLSCETADLFRLKTQHMGDYHRGEAGRTFYIGSRQSPVFNRIYEKGIQSGGNPLHVRSELEFKPKTEQARTVYSMATPEQILIASTWSKHFYGILTGIKGMKLAPAGTIKKLTTDQQSFLHMMKQYGPLLGRMLEGFGGDYCALGLHISGQLGQPVTPIIKHVPIHLAGCDCGVCFEHIKPADNG